MQVYDWQVIVKEHGPVVWQTAHRLLGDPTETADCFQEAFLAALEVSRRQRVRNVCGLLVRLATTRAIDRLRRRSRQELRQADTRCRRNISDGERDPASRLETHELAGRLREAIGQLPPQEAKAFSLRYLSEMSYRQIAKELNINTNTAGVLLHRAKAKLRKALAPA